MIASAVLMSKYVSIALFIIGLAMLCVAGFDWICHTSFVLLGVGAQ